MNLYEVGMLLLPLAYNEHVAGAARRPLAIEGLDRKQAFAFVTGLEDNAFSVGVDVV